MFGEQTDPAHMSIAPFSVGRGLDAIPSTQVGQSPTRDQSTATSLCLFFIFCIEIEWRS